MQSDDMSREEIQAWGDSRETSPEVAEAILYIARDFDEAERMWQDPTATEISHIADRATKNFQLDPADMHWGEGTLAAALAGI